MDAARVIPDSDPDGEPVVQNGIALCKIHHAAFDHFFLSIRPDYRIEIRRDVMVERDSPMLKHGLQGLDGQQIELPSQIRLRPSVRMLGQRHQKFLEFGAGGTG